MKPTLPTGAPTSLFRRLPCSWTAGPKLIGLPLFSRPIPIPSSDDSNSIGLSARRMLKIGIGNRSEPSAPGYRGYIWAPPPTVTIRSGLRACDSACAAAGADESISRAVAVADRVTDQ